MFCVESASMSPAEGNADAETDANAPMVITLKDRIKFFIDFPF